MDRFERIANEMVASNMEQGWYWLPRSKRVALWTRQVAPKDRETERWFIRMMDEAEKATLSAASIVGFKSQWTYREVMSYRGKPAAVATAQLLAQPEDMEFLKEGQP
jgi:hypothetical protein